MDIEKARLGEAIRLVRALNEQTDRPWRIRARGGQKMIECRKVDPSTKEEFWSFEGWAEDRRDLAALARDFGLEL